MTASNVDLLRLAAEMADGRQPFVMASVVWRRTPSSGRAGAKALILADGTVQGWIGGACAEPTVIARALECMRSGEPELLFLGQGDALDERSRATLTSVPMACESDGALEVFLEPIVPALRLIVVGRSPAVDAMASMGRALGWDACIVDDGGSPDDHPIPDLVHTKLDLGALVADAACAVVVATQGHYDDLALAAALMTPAGYIGLVASERRASAVLDQLRADGQSSDQLGRIDAPAGLDLGSVPNVEMAAAVIADLVARRARGELQQARVDGPTPTATVVDPICGMTVDPSTAKYHSVHHGADHWFCASGCKRAFDADPDAALSD